MVMDGQEGGAMDEQDKPTFENDARGMIHAEISKGTITMTEMVRLMTAAYRRGRREAIEDAAEWLEITVYPGKRGASLSQRMRDRERDLARNAAKGAAQSDLPQRPGAPPWVRGPDGKPDNCAIANGAPESECQMCAGSCPDRAKGSGRGQ